MKTYYCVLYILIYMIFCAHPFCFLCVLSNGIRLRQQDWNMEPLPHYMNLYLRFHDPEPWQWEHHWDTHHHTYHRLVTIRMMRTLPGPRGWIPITMHTRITLDLHHNNPFACPHPPPPPEVEADEMDVDLPADYVFPAPMDEDTEEEDPEEEDPDEVMM